MKHGWLILQGRIVSRALVFFLIAAAPAFVKAQLHSGQHRNYQAAVRTSGTALGRETISGSDRAGTTMIRRGDRQNAAIINTGYIDGTSLVSTDMRDADLWARAIIHADGSFTETKKTDEAGQALIQRTMSANGVLLQERVITANGRGHPSEVLIKDATGQFKYRGVLLYDRTGRFIEEQLYDMNDQLLRRRIQDYGPKGEPKLRVLDYTENIPVDLQLVITDKNSIDRNSDHARRNYDRFRRDAREVQAGSNGAEKKKGFFGRIGQMFSRKKKT